MFKELLVSFRPPRKPLVVVRVAHWDLTREHKASLWALKGDSEKPRPRSCCRLFIITDSQSPDFPTAAVPAPRGLSPAQSRVSRDMRAAPGRAALRSTAR